MRNFIILVKDPLLLQSEGFRAVVNEIGLHFLELVQKRGHHGNRSVDDNGLGGIRTPDSVVRSHVL